MVHQHFGRRIARIEVDSADHGFDGIGQDGRALLAARLEFAFAQSQHVWQLQAHGDAVQRVLFHQIGAHARKVAFGQSL
ncbi:hypothetical protein D3C78_1502570 [compost metagenome]